MQITTIEYKCDRCGVTSERRDFRDGSAAGFALVDIEGNQSGACHDGAWGGMNYHHKAELCFRCAKGLRDFYLKYMKTE